MSDWRSMDLLMYSELAEWWPLLSAPEDYAAEAAEFADAIDAAARAPVREVLELGSGGGNNASHMKDRFHLTLVDRSPDMLAVSRTLNPECTHIGGDMRSIRLGRTFDAVFVHDAIAYMTTEEDLAAVFATAAAHLSTGGVAVFTPDHTTESFLPRSDSGGRDGKGRFMRYLEWSHAPAKGNTWFITSFAYLVKEGDGPVRALFEDHRTGLFPRATWLELLDIAGFDAGTETRRTEFDGGYTPEFFVGIRR